VILYPAIDIRGGEAVRLLQGDYNQQTIYDADPVVAARRWAGDKAKFLHVVDLDGAKAGQPRNLEIVRKIVANVGGCPVQLGGGLRDLDWVKAAFDTGVERVVVGTAALRDPGFLEKALDTYGERVVVSIDARGGKVSLAGWTETSEKDAVEAVAELSERGVSRFLFTSIEVDGTMDGPLITELNQIADATKAKVIASGGVGDLSDLRVLAQEAAPNVEGVIVGRALYERKFTVAEANATLKRPSR